MKKLYSITDLTEKEFNLIMRIRTKYRYGEFVVVTHNGQPSYLKEPTKRDNLDTKLVDE